MSEQEGLISQLRKAASVGDAAALEQALVGGADAREGESWALRVAAERGHAECVRLLMEFSDPLARQVLCFVPGGPVWLFGVREASAAIERPVVEKIASIGLGY